MMQSKTHLSLTNYINFLADKHKMILILHHRNFLIKKMVYEEQNSVNAADWGCDH